MRKTLSAWCSVLLAITSYDCLAQKTTPATESRQIAPSEIPEPYVQISSVAIDPTTIHIRRDPRRATVIVQIMLHGEPPTNAEARVDIGTCSSDPPAMEVRYSQPQTVPIKKQLTVLRFTVEAWPKTSQGKLKVAATIYGPATKGVHIRPPESPKDCVAELTTLDP